MPNISSSLRTKLLSVSAITSLIGQRMYIDVLKQNATLPAVVFTRISTRRAHSVSDVTKLAHSQFEFACIAKSRATADAIADAIRSSGICSFSGVVDSINFLGAEIESGDEYGDDPPIDGSQEHRYWTCFELVVHYQES